MSTWICCAACEAEFRVVSGIGCGPIEFCAFCGSELDASAETEDEIDIDSFDE